MSQGTAMIEKACMAFGKVSKSISGQYLKSHYIQVNLLTKSIHF